MASASEFASGLSGHSQREVILWFWICFRPGCNEGGNVFESNHYAFAPNDEYMAIVMVLEIVEMV